MKKAISSISKIFILTMFVASFAGCAPDICNCLDEADKEKPDQEILDKCRAQFTNMNQDQIDAAVKKCGR